MLRQRLAVAAVGLPLLGLLLVTPEPIYAAAVELILAIAAYELYTAAVPETERAPALAAAATTALFVALVRVNADVPLHWMLAVLAALLLFAVRPRESFGSL